MLIANEGSAKIYNRCELAKELLLKHKVPKDELATWVCIAQHESSYDTSAIGRLNGDGSEDHGLFQISDLYWCSKDGPGKACSISCSDLEDSDIRDDLTCVRKIYQEHTRLSGDGFTAWAVYGAYCKGTKSKKYLEGCFDKPVGTGYVQQNVQKYEVDDIVNDTARYYPTYKTTGVTRNYQSTLDLSNNLFLVNHFKKHPTVQTTAPTPTYYYHKEKSTSNYYNQYSQTYHRQTTPKPTYSTFFQTPTRSTFTGSSFISTSKPSYYQNKYSPHYQNSIRSTQSTFPTTSHHRQTFSTRYPTYDFSRYTSKISTQSSPTTRHDPTKNYYFTKTSTPKLTGFTFSQPQTTKTPSFTYSHSNNFHSTRSSSRYTIQPTKSTFTTKSTHPSAFHNQKSTVAFQNSIRPTQSTFLNSNSKSTPSSYFGYYNKGSTPSYHRTSTGFSYNFQQNINNEIAKKNIYQSRPVTPTTARPVIRFGKFTDIFTYPTIYPSSTNNRFQTIRPTKSPGFTQTKAAFPSYKTTSRSTKQTKSQFNPKTSSTTKKPEFRSNFFKY